MITDRDIDELRVRVGDPITARLWNAMLDLCAGLHKSYRDISGGKGVRLHRYPDGINIVADTGGANFVGAFAVRQAGALAVTVGAGMLNTIIPKIDGVPIDGVVDGRQRGIPPLKVEMPGADMRSFVCLRVVTDDAQRIVDAPDAVTVVHRTTMPAADEPAEVGLHVIAMLQWSDRTTFRVWQVLYHHQQHIAIKERSGGVRHFFTAAA